MRGIVDPGGGVGLRQVIDRDIEFFSRLIRSGSRGGGHYNDGNSAGQDSASHGRSGDDSKERFTATA
jgi:hypothetical protein